MCTAWRHRPSPPDSPDVKYLQAHLGRLDPAHKCISCAGFRGADAHARAALLEEFLKTKFVEIHAKLRIEHVSTGKWEDRKVTGIISLVELNFLISEYATTRP